MTFAFTVAVLSLWATGSSPDIPVISVPKVLSFCTNAGPVELTIDGNTATGWYLLVVTPEVKKGTIKGTFDKGLIHAVWTDPDGSGKIIFGFNPDLTQFIAIYNRGDDSSHWYNEWKGVSKNKVLELPENSRKYLHCEFK